jgi:type I restriction enzyme S subunit
MSAVDEGGRGIARPEIKRYSNICTGYTYFGEGDVLFAKITPCMENGKHAIAKGLIDGIGFGSTEFHVLHPMGEIIPEWIHFFLLQSYVTNGAAATFAGAVGQQRVPRTYLTSLEIPLAPLAEQRRIVSEIERQFTRLDAGVKALERTKANLKRYRASVLKAACEGRLVPQDPNDETADKLMVRILKERRHKWEDKQIAKMNASGSVLNETQWKDKYKEPEELDTSHLTKLPIGWVWATVEQIGIVQLGHQRSPKNRAGRYAAKYVRAANITWKGLDLSDMLEMDFKPNERNTYRLLPGDILLSEASGSANEVGKPAIWIGELEDCYFQNTVIRIQSCGPTSEFLYLLFLHYATNGSFAKVAQGIQIRHLGAERLSSVPVPIPPLGEQKRISSELMRRLSFLDELSLYLQTSLSRASNLRQSILKAGFSGKLAAQNQSDEPASALLERIRNERANLHAELKLSKVAQPRGPRRKSLKRRETT